MSEKVSQGAGLLLADHEVKTTGEAGADVIENILADVQTRERRV